MTEGISLSAADEQAIRAVLREYGATWNWHDLGAMAALFAEDAHWVNIVGWYWAGKAAVVGGHEAIHRTFFRTTDIEIDEIAIRALAPEVAAAVVRLKVGPFLPPDDVQRPASEDRLTLILAKRAGAWSIVHGHNTVIDPAARAFDPIAARDRRA